VENNPGSGSGEKILPFPGRRGKKNSWGCKGIKRIEKSQSEARNLFISQTNKT